MSKLNFLFMIKSAYLINNVLSENVMGLFDMALLAASRVTKTPKGRVYSFVMNLSAMAVAWRLICFRCSRIANLTE